MSKREKISGKYFSDEVNVIDKLYSPCLKWADKYVRDAGYFNSSVYRTMGKEILDFVLRDPKNHIFLITNLDISPSDYDAIVSESSKSEDQIINELNSMLEDEVIKDPVKMLAAIVNAGQMTVYVSLRKRQTNKSNNNDHSKSGYFSKDSKITAFDGSINETYPATIRGLEKGNKEHFNIYDNEELLEDFWNRYADPIRRRLDNDLKGSFPKKTGEGTIIVEINSIDREQLPALNDEDWDPENHKIRAQKRTEKLFQEFEKEILPKYKRGENIKNIDNNRLQIELRPHQKEGMQKWKENGFIGTLEHATGSGKTITAITAIEEHLTSGFPVVVLVPGQILLDQWSKEIEKFIQGANILKVDSRYKKDWLNHLSVYCDNSPYIEQKRIVVASIHSARTNNFLTRVGTLKNALVVVDECHRIGSISFSEICQWKPAKKLGLSATPERYGDIEGTERMQELCGKSIHKYSLRDALNAPPPGPYLTPYIYNIEKVNLTNEHEFCGDKSCKGCETDNYDQRTAAIKKWIAKIINSQKKKSISWKDFPPRLQNEIIQVKNVIKKAHNKIGISTNIIKENYEPNKKQNWLIYCQDGQQLQELRESLENQQIKPIYEYWSRAEGAESDSNKKREKFAKEETLKLWEIKGGIMISIACLDEGVDIPCITHGIILASSQNPRQFIQRRGRLLRLHENKNFARIWDTLVIPSSESGGTHTDYILNEINRAAIFAEDAEAGNAKIELINIRHDLNLTNLFKHGNDGSDEGEGQ